MSMDPAMIQQMLTQQLQQGPPSAAAGGGTGGPRMQSQTSPVNAAATLASKLMLMKALQNQKAGGGSPLQQYQANSMLPGTGAQVGADPSMQTLQQSPQMDPALLQQLQQPQPIAPVAPSALPTS